MRPSVQGVTPGELLRLAASVDQVSAHVLGDALAEAAAGAGLRLTLPSQVHELPGQGIGGVVGDRPVAVGSPTFLRSVGVPGDEIAAAVTLGGRG
jgi:cation transport ATPase